MTPVLWKVVMLASLWPFSGGDQKDEEPATIESLGTQEVVIDRSAPIPDSRDQAIRHYKKFLELAEDDPLRAEAMRRLADLQLEASEARRIEQNLPTLEGEDFENAVVLYRQLLDSFPGNPDNDQVLYQLARAYESNGDAEQALAALDQLVARYPASRHMAEAQFRRGEILFVNRRYAQAEEAYARVLEAGPKTPYYEQSLYKHGWSSFKQIKHDEGLHSFLDLLDRILPSDADEEYLQAMPNAGRELVEDTLRALSISLAYLDGPASIETTVAGRRNTTYVSLLYDRLGGLYLDKERYQDAAETYLAFVKRDPLHRRAPLFQMRAVEAYEKGGFPTLVLQAKRDFVQRYSLESEYFALYNQKDFEPVLEALKGNLEELARHAHAQAQSSGKPTDYAEAARWYRQYLRSFPADPQAPANNFLLAELLFESNDFPGATAEYERTAYDYPKHEKAAEAGYAALTAYAEHQKRLSGGSAEEWHRMSVESGIRFARAFPEHRHATAVLTKAAEDLFSLGELDMSIIITDLVIEAPDATADQLRVVWTVRSHAQFDLAMYAEAEQGYLVLRSRLKRDDPALEQLEERIAASIYRQGEIKRADGDLAGAAADFLRVGKTVPRSSIRATAEYDAAAAYLAAGAWTRALPVLERFRADHPGHAYQAEVTRQLAVAYLEIGDNLKAAAELENIAAGAGASEQIRREALAQAADLYSEEGRLDKAALVLERFVQRYPLPLDPAMDARERLADLARERGDGAARTRWLQAMVEADGAAGESRTGRSITLAAGASLELAEPVFRDFMAVKLTLPLEQSLKRKRERMEQALAAYKRAADYGISEVTTAATYYIAEVYRQLSADLMDSERPEDLGEEELEQYGILLEEQAYPFEEQSIEIHQANARRTRDGIYDHWVQMSFDRLSVLMPARYAKVEIQEQAVETLE